MRAVIFDLWETLAVWPRNEMSPLLEAAGLTLAEWESPEHRDVRWTGPFDVYLRGLGLDAQRVERAVALRVEMTRRALVPVDGASALLDEVRARGLRTGLVSNDTSETGAILSETPFAGRFDAVVVSAEVGLRKPDPRICEHALAELGVTACEALYVGDGDSDELAGAERVGIRAVQVGSRDGWNGERIETLTDVLTLLPTGGLA